MKYAVLWMWCVIFSMILSIYACSLNNNGSGSIDDNIDTVASLFSKTSIAAEREYRNIDGKSLQLDVYVPSKRLGESPWVKYTDGLKPTLLYFHGGGWRSGEKESRSLEILPYVEKGWVVVSANYRNLYQTSLPEVVGDCRTALNWVYDHAEKYNIDTAQIILAGNSAGGHLALMTALANDDAIYGSSLSSKNRRLNVAGVVNWYGISNVKIFTAGWKDKHILIRDSTRLDWVYDVTSPINYIDNNAPPMLTIHGAIDKVVPFIHAESLHAILNELGLKNKLLKIENRKHGDFDAKEMTSIYNEVWKFLSEIGIEEKYL